MRSCHSQQRTQIRDMKLTVSFWSLVPMMYAAWTFATVARIHVLSVDIPLIIVGGDEPTSQICICSCDQKSANVEFCDRHVCITLAALLLALDPWISELRGISSNF